MTAQEIAQYYPGLLIIQYVGKPKAFDTVQAVVTPVVMFQDTNGSLPSLPLAVQDAFNLNPTIQGFTFSPTPDAGTFTLSYAGSPTSVIPFNATAGSISAVLASLLGTGQVSVSGSIGSPGLAVSFLLNTAPVVFTASSSLTSGGSPVAITVSTNQAVGVQLDVLGKYAGVTRSGFGLYGPVTLDDADFLKLIQMAIISNNNGSSLATIVGFLNKFFPGLILCVDEANTAPMQMTYVISTAIGSSGLLQLFVVEGLLPHPMGVGIAVIAPPQVNNLFGYCDYRTATPTNPNTHVVAPYNNGSSYTLGNLNTSWIYMDYKYSLKA